MREKCKQSDNRVNCIPNHPVSSHDIPILSNTGFYELPFEHASCSALLHLWNATRVPSIIIVRNSNRMVIAHCGWEAIEREGVDGGVLDQWIDSDALEAKKGGNERNNDSKKSLIIRRRYDCQVVNKWKVDCLVGGIYLVV